MYPLLPVQACDDGKQPMRTKSTSLHSTVCQTVVKRSNGKTSAVLAASLQRTWCTGIPIFYPIHGPHCPSAGPIGMFEASMLTTFKDPMCKCSLWKYDVLRCQIAALDELSAW